MASFLRGVWGVLGRFLEITILSMLILAARCANYQDVFVAGNVYFTDADCYARMTRVRMCAEHPGLIVRHHDFENFPEGTKPHTTAPFDYAVLALSIALRPFTALPLELGGAFISPLLALLGGWFLWWWSRRMKIRYRWMLLILYGISPILVHGTGLGRPDHQSLLIFLVGVALCAQWSWFCSASRPWGVASGVAWGSALWVSAYEPLILFLLLLLFMILFDSLSGRTISLGSFLPRPGWISFAGIVVVALLIERRLPSWPVFAADPILRNWSQTIGELRPISPLHSIWFRWTGWLLPALPFLIWRSYYQRSKTESGNRVSEILIAALVAATYLLTIWQARWGYFFVLIFIIAIPLLLRPIKSQRLVWIAFVLSLYPILRDWDERLWPNESEIARRVEQRNEADALRNLAAMMQSVEVRPFLAPWWLSPALAYWSRQPGVAGSSHESINGIADTARFYQNADPQKALKILENHKVEWVLGYDAERTGQSCRAILGEMPSEHALCYVLDRVPAQAPRFLSFAAQNSTGKLFRVANNR